jgi:hypothetical protein
MPLRAINCRENSNMVKVALKDIDFEAVRRIAYIAAVSAPLVIFGACSQQAPSGDTSGDTSQEAAPAPDEAAPPADEAAPPADEAAPPADEAAPPADSPPSE